MEATPRRRRDGEATRRRVLDAVVRCILEQGYYQSTSNEIARRAGVTWGAIQHLFGSREALMIAVLEDGWKRLQERVGTEKIGGGSLEVRLWAVLGVLATYYESPEHLAAIQILLDFTANPATSDETRRAIKRHGQELLRAWEPLFAQALGEAARDDDLVVYAFSTLRGYLTSRRIADTIADLPPDTVQRQLLVNGVAASLRAEARRRGLSLR
ncbi:MAG TPA: TetR/AcrR family transcriptional regulator [Acidimicrobiia bacterium]|nr:TetR/AcrR family transcriptional regulator [Acidimicrobiia bacterium]